LSQLGYVYLSQKRNCKLSESHHIVLHCSIIPYVIDEEGREGEEMIRKRREKGQNEMGEWWCW
jgi:hypothetical protein